MASDQVHDLGTISRASKGNLAPRDCAEIAHPHPGHLEALPSNETRRGCHGDIQNGRVRSDSTKWSSMVVIGAWVHLGAFRLVCASCRKSPSNTHALSTTILGHFVESERTRPFPISPWHALRAPLDGKASRWPECWCAISAQSRGARFPLDASEIAPRSCTCTQAI